MKPFHSAEKLNPASSSVNPMESIQQLASRLQTEIQELGNNPTRSRQLSRIDRAQLDGFRRIARFVTSLATGGSRSNDGNHDSNGGNSDIEHVEVLTRTTALGHSMPPPSYRELPI